MSEQDLAKIIGTRIAAMRISRELTAKEVASAAGISPTFLTRVERGRSILKATDLVRIARRLGVRTSTLTGEERFDPTAILEDA